MKKLIMQVLEVIGVIFVALVFTLILFVSLLFLPIGLALEELSCWAQDKADEK